MTRLAVYLLVISAAVAMVATGYVTVNVDVPENIPGLDSSHFEGSREKPPRQAAGADGERSPEAGGACADATD